RRVPLKHDGSSSTSDCPDFADVGPAHSSRHGIYRGNRYVRGGGDPSAALQFGHPPRPRRFTFPDRSTSDFGRSYSPADARLRALVLDRPGDPESTAAEHAKRKRDSAQPQKNGYSCAFRRPLITLLLAAP